MGYFYNIVYDVLLGSLTIDFSIDLLLQYNNTSFIKGSYSEPNIYMVIIYDALTSSSWIRRTTPVMQIITQ